MDGDPDWSWRRPRLLDGAGSLTVLWRIVVPLIRPALIVVAVWQFLFSWNEFFLALVIMTRERDEDPAAGAAVLSRGRT